MHPGGRNIFDRLASDIYALSLNRSALGFPIAGVPVEPWPEYFGYQTARGTS